MLYLITGGAGSGKSAWAEELVCRLPGQRIYLATMRPWDGECRARIARHRAQRAGRDFITLERYTDLAGVAPQIPEGANVLLECMGNLTANVLFGPGGPPENPLEAVTDGLRRLAEQCNHLIVVGNDVFAEDGGCDAGTRAYLDLLAGLHRRFHLLRHLHPGGKSGGLALFDQHRRGGIGHRRDGGLRPQEDRYRRNLCVGVRFG